MVKKVNTKKNTKKGNIESIIKLQRKISIQYDTLTQLIYGIENRVIDKTTKIWDSLLEKLNTVNLNFREQDKKMFNRFEEIMLERQRNFEMVMRGQLERVADDSIRALYALQRLTQLIDDTVFTPEVRERIIAQMKMIPKDAK